MIEYSPKNQITANTWNQLAIILIDNQTMIGDCAIQPSAKIKADVSHQKLSDQNQ
jgi:hypothetical protein